MNHYLFNSTVILQHSVELLISFYLLGFISYAVFFNGLQTLAFPALLNSMLLFSTFIIFSSLLLYLTCDLSLLSDNSFGALDITLFDSAFSMILMLSVLFLQIICRKTLNRQGIYKYEYDLIMVFSILGLVLLNGCNDFLVFYLALELQSLGFYVLATFQRNSEYNAEAGLKYFVLGALSSGLLLFGFSLIYITYGSVYFEVITKLSIISENGLALWGFIFVLVALFFKIGAFPFHQWLCDVYEGSFVTVTAFFSVAPKAIIFAIFIKLLYVFFFDFLYFSNLMIIFSGFLSISFASVTALYQKRVKRLLAYSAISHTGFILVALACNSLDAIKTAVIYISIYILMTISVFSVLFILLNNNKMPKFLINWASISKHNLMLALSFACILFSVAGIPPLSGFFSKLFVLGSLFFDGYLVLPALIAIFSSIGCFYYLRLIKMFFFSDQNKTIIWTGNTSGRVEVFTSVLILFITFFFFNPDPLVDIGLLTSLSLA